MTANHSLSTAMHSMEIENAIMSDVLDSLFARGALNVTEARKIQGILHRRGCETLTTESIARRVVEKYRERVKSFSDPDSGCKDSSFTRAVKSVGNLLKVGFNHGRLIYAVENYARECEAQNKKWAYRFAVGNFFGRAEEYKAYLPEGDVVVGDPKKAATVETLFGGDSPVE